MSFHAVCHCTAAAAALSVLASDSVGTSIMTTCFIQSGTKAEYFLTRVLLIVPLCLYSPLCLCAAVYSLHKYRTHFLLRRYIIKHLFVVLAFTVCWFFPALIHLLNEKDINEARHQPVLSGIAMITGAISGFITVFVRFLEPGFIGRLRSKKINTEFTSNHFSPQPVKTSDIEIISRKRAGSFPASLNYSQAIVQNSKQFAQTLVIALHYCFERYQDRLTYSRCCLLDLTILRPYPSLYTFTKDNLPDFQCEVEEHLPEVFQLLRLRDDVTETGLSKALDPAANWTQTTEVTGGRSGSFFFKTADGSVILKTISQEELAVLRGKVIPKWPEVTVFSHFYGLFSVKLPGTLHEHVLICHNLTQMLKPVYATFDLKGSRFNRKVLKKPTATTPLVQSDTLKDTDFQMMIGKLSLSEEDVDRLTTCIFADVSLLHSLKLMDYSLLIGIGEFSQPVESIPLRVKRHLFKCMNAPNRFYSIGIIDFLQGYSISKRLERMGKRLLASSMEISSVSPDAYSDRFLDMVSEITE